MQGDKNVNMKKGVKYSIILGAVALYTLGIWKVADVVISNNYETSSYSETEVASQQESVVSFTTDTDSVVDTGTDAGTDSVIDTDTDTGTDSVESVVSDSKDVNSVVETDTLTDSDSTDSDSIDSEEAGVSFVKDIVSNVSSNPNVTYVEGNAIYVNDLGEGYEDVDPSAVTVDERGRTYIYGQEKGVWDHCIDNAEKKADIKAQYYCDELYSIPYNDYYERAVLCTIDMLSRDISPYRDMIANATYETRDSKNERGIDVIYACFTFEDGTTLDFRYSSDVPPDVIIKNGTFSIEEVKYFKWFLDPPMGRIDVEDFGGNSIMS